MISTVMESLGSMSNDREQVVVVIQPIQNFYINYIISCTTDHRQNT